MESLLDGKVMLHCGDCLAVLPSLPADSFDACVTDPPYHLASIVKRFGAEGAAPAKSNGATGVYQRASSGFMGKRWDGGDIAFRPETWAAVLRTLKPGAHLVAFAAPKNAHRLTCAIEDAGFEIRDVVMWLFGSGFPKSHNVSKFLDRWLDYGEEGQAKKDSVVDDWEGWGTALKPAYEPIILARKPLDHDFTIAGNVLQHGTGAINIAACRVGCADKTPFPVGATSADGSIVTGLHSKPREGDSAPDGRWPANIAHDGSAEVLELFPGDLKSGKSVSRSAETAAGYRPNAFGAESRPSGVTTEWYGDSGSAARFFYCAKANADERAGSKHPTVKPLALLQWLVRMVTPKTILECPNCMRGKNETLPGDLQGMRSAVRTDMPVGASEALLLNTLRKPGDRKNAIVNEGIHDIEQGISAASSPEPSECQGGICDGTSSGDRADDRAPTDLGRGSPSHQWHQGGQPFGEFAANDQAGARFDESTQAEPGQMSALRRSAQAEPKCHSCGGVMTRRPGRILDCFAGTGTVAEAAHREGVNATLIEADAQSADDIRRRVRLIYAGPEERANALRVAAGKVEPIETAPLFRAA